MSFSHHAKLATRAMVSALCLLASTAGIQADDLQIGQDLYQSVCAVCHGSTAAGGSGPDLRGISQRMDVDDVVMFMTAPPDTMPNFSNALTAEELRRIAEYLSTL